MNLLPRTAADFSSAEYWERFFKKRGEKSFEWYGDYNKLCGVLHKYIKVQHKVGNVGMQLSKLNVVTKITCYNSVTVDQLLFGNFACHHRPVGA